ncbi:hypothetical protein [uncultured Paraglaciecola sp.]|uniref:hypothetical protein n=1 Tax=uncultured Paraglaciecola sp. TaxID=1765024 RepID=UPI00261E7A08|nr:hypothetical protein [uncultured Paraglaciecola sp.]
MLELLTPHIPAIIAGLAGLITALSMARSKQKKELQDMETSVLAAQKNEFKVLTEQLAAVRKRLAKIEEERDDCERKMLSLITVLTRHNLLNDDEIKKILGL